MRVGVEERGQVKRKTEIGRKGCVCVGGGGGGKG